MNILQQLRAVLPHETRAVAKLTAPKGNGAWTAQTTAGKAAVVLYGTGYQVGQTVFYDVSTGRILEIAPDLTVIEIDV